MRAAAPRVVPPKPRPPKAASVIVKRSKADVMQEAEERLLANGQEQVCWDDIALLTENFCLSDHVELGLKLLHPVKLRLLLGTREELERQLDNAGAEKREELMRSTIAKFDPLVERLLQEIEQNQDMEHTSAEADDGSLDDQRATDPEPAMPCAATGIQVPPHASHGPHVSAQAPRAQLAANLMAARGVHGGWLPPRWPGSGKPVAARPARSRSPRGDDSAGMRSSVANEVNINGETIRNVNGEWIRVSKSRTDVGNSLSTTSGLAMPSNGRSDLRPQPPPQPPPVYSSSDVNLFLVKCKLDAFEDQLRELGVERLADLKYVTDDDLKGMGMSIIQCRKFREAVKWTEGSQQADEHPPRNRGALPQRPAKDRKGKSGTWHEQTAGDENIDATPRSSPAQRKKEVIGGHAQWPQPNHSQQSTSAAIHRPAGGGEARAVDIGCRMAKALAQEIPAQQIKAVISHIRQT